MTNIPMMVSTIIGMSLISILLIILIILVILCIKKSGLRDNIIHVVFSTLIVAAFGYMIYFIFHEQEGEIVNKAIVTNHTIVETEDTPVSGITKYFIQIKDKKIFVEISKKQYEEFNIGESFKYRRGLVNCEHF